jgi:hypothetical protein
MEKTLRFKIDGKEYKLAYTRETVIETENMGFNINDILAKPISSLTLLWHGAFLAHHDSLTNAEVDELFDKVSKKGLMDALIDLYKAPVESLFDEENSKNAVKWTVE